MAIAATDLLADRLGRRFEAVVLVGEPVLAEVPAETVRALRQAGVGVALVANAPVGELARGAGPAAGAGALLLADGRGVDVAVAVGGELRRFRRVEIDTSPLDRAAEGVVERLAGMGLASSAMPRAAGSLAAAVLVSGAPAGSSLPRMLLDQGLSGSSVLLEVVAAVARDAGLDGARVAVDGPRVEIRLGHEGDAVQWVCAELWTLGIGRANVLIVAGGLGTERDDFDPFVEPGLDRATLVSVDIPAALLPPGAHRLPHGLRGIAGLLDDQLRRRDRRDVPAAVAEPGWGLARDGFDPERERVNEACFSLADGRIGRSGAPLASHPSTRPWVLAGGVYVGDGPETRLLTAPTAFRLPCGIRPGGRLRRVLDLRTGVLYEEVEGEHALIRSARFSSLARPGTVAMRARCTPAPRDHGPALQPPADDPPLDAGRDGDVVWMRVAAGPGGVSAAATDELGPAGEVLDRFGTYLADATSLPPPQPAAAAARDAAATGFDRLLDEHRRAWAARWDDADIVVEGDDELQLAVRFALFHLMATAPDEGEAAVGARGVTGTGYRGHVFWDADTFVLPFLAATHPAAARAMLEYRVRRLPAALDAARAAGRAGARFPWESARSGRDVTPLSARDRAGRLVRIRTGQLEDHIVSEVAWASRCYVEWSGDEDFARGPGLRLLVETARYWASRMRVEADGRAHIYGVIGPDEYHEPVDDNAFTNVMARWNLRQAAAAVDEWGPEGPGAGRAEVDRWRALAGAVVDGWNADTGVYEQFAGFDRLDPLIIAEVAPRRPIAADLLLGADAVRRAQILKQADVLMLHHLVPEEVMPGTLEPNLRHYEPRTAHGSSLSPSIHASLFARARQFDRALETLRVASRIDLDDLTGTTAGGLHLATMGGLWQAFAFGFFGLRPSGGRLHIDPRLPPAWSALEIRVRFRGVPVRIQIRRAVLTVHAGRPVDVVVGGAARRVGAGETTFARRGPTWELSS